MTQEMKQDAGRTGWRALAGLPPKADNRDDARTVASPGHANSGPFAGLLPRTMPRTFRTTGPAAAAARLSRFA